MSRSESRNFSLTYNNPRIPMTEFFDQLCSGATYAKAQHEMGTNGTPHYQCCVGYKTARRLTAMIARFKGCHVEPAKNAMALWNYCSKESTRIEEGVLTYGIPPASKSVKGDTKKRNEMILEYGIRKAIDEGIVAIEKAAQVQKGLNLYHS